MKSILLVVVTVIVLSACSTSGTSLPTLSSPTAIPGTTNAPLPPPNTPSVSSQPTLTPFPTLVMSNIDGLLAEILSRGTMIISTDPNFEPQSFLNPAGQRPANTKCTADQLSAAELQGFDIDVSTQLGLRLGVEPCFVTPSFSAVEAGNWGNKWDISVGSLRITSQRMKVLAFTAPYYYENSSIPLGIAVDHGHTLAIKSLLAALDQAVNDMHQDGTLSSLSVHWFGKDLSTK